MSATLQLGVLILHVAGRVSAVTHDTNGQSGNENWNCHNKTQEEKRLGEESGGTASSSVDRLLEHYCSYSLVFFLCVYQHLGVPVLLGLHQALTEMVSSFCFFVIFIVFG